MTLDSILHLALASAPWLLLGLVLAGLIKPLMPQELIQRMMGGNGLGAIVRSSMIGIPLPLCSCGAIPTAIALHRAGAGRGPATSFLVSTPGVGVDSLALSYALLGPFMTVARLLGAILSAIACGLGVALSGRPGASTQTEKTAEDDGCCADDACAVPVQAASTPSRLRAVAQGLAYAFSDLLDDISLWLAAGMILAGILMAHIPDAWMSAYGQGLPAMLVLAVVGIPLYICASAATPIAAAMLVLGVSPGATLVFLLAASITSSATLAVFWRCRHRRLPRNHYYQHRDDRPKLRRAALRQSMEHLPLHRRGGGIHTAMAGMVGLDHTLHVCHQTPAQALGADTQSHPS